jgi:hypothetical protein
MAREIRLGALVRPKACSICGSKGKIRGHHEDYEYPLHVIWVCTMCHSKIHNRRPKQMYHYKERARYLFLKILSEKRKRTPLVPRGRHLRKKHV